MAPKIVYVMLYGFAVEERERWLRPATVTNMTDAQAARQSPAARTAWIDEAQGRGRPRNVPGRWYGENTRESIRDETIRTLVKLGAIIERRDLPTTSPCPRYALADSFAALFDPRLTDARLASSISTWRDEHLSRAVLARITLVRRGAGKSSDRTLVTLPNGETRSLAAGASGLLTRSVIETFALNFLHEPAVVMISESAKRMTYRDESLSKAIGLAIAPDQVLPDVVLVDLGSVPPLLVFVECVVTDGPVDERRREELERLALASGFRVEDCVYVTAFGDRAESPFRAIASALSWGSFAWFATEPASVMYLRRGEIETQIRLADLLGAGRPRSGS
jgi:BsuBI/PstI restriction endonuclease domain/BsuBI/PstI restriction endonuclease HTH domain